VKIRQNGDWLTELKLKDIIKIGSNISATQLFKRENFTRRIAKGDVVWYHETMYPLLQGYDSVVMDVDLEIGGTDQEFNMLIGRELQRKMNDREKFVLTTPMINGVDGKKMSKSVGNCIWLTDKPETIYSKIMSMADDMITTYYELLTDIPMDEIAALDPNKPIENKKRLAYDITRQLHGEDGAKIGESHYNTVIQPKAAPSEMPELKLSPNTSILEALKSADLGVSNADIKRTLEQNGVEVDGVKVSDPQAVVNGQILKFGKRTYRKIVLA
jgi:tyrosyl-tRNA synthetase